MVTSLIRLGPGKLIQKINDTNSRNKLEKMKRQKRNRLQEEIVTWSLIIIAGIFTYISQNTIIISALIISLINTVAKILAIFGKDLITIIIMKKGGVIYTGLVVQTKFLTPIVVLLTIASWRITLMVMRKTGYFTAHLSRFLLPGLPE